MFTRKPKTPKTAAGLSRAIGYIRVSSQEQAKDGVSIDRQEAQIKAYCALKGIEGLEIIADRGASGFKANRPGFKKLLELCKAGQVSVVIVYDLSRLSRSVRNTIEFFDEVVGKRGVEFVSLKETIDTTTPMGKASLAMISIFNELYRNEISYKTKSALGHKKKNGEKTGGVIPFGYSLINGRYLMPLPGEQATIKTMHSLRAAGYSLREIVAQLAERGIKTKTGGAKWDHRTVREILDRQYTDVCMDHSISDEEKNPLLEEIGDSLSLTEAISKKKTAKRKHSA